MGTAAARRRLAGDGNSPAPVIFMDESGNTGVGTKTGTPQYTRLQDGSGTVVAAVSSGDADDRANGVALLLVQARKYVFDGVTWDRERTAATFKPFSVTVASLGIAPQAAWTPTSGKRFRMMGYNLTSSKAASVQFRDGSVATFAASGALVANTPGPAVSIGNGYLSASVNNVLNLDVDTAVPVVISGMIWGTEE